MTTEGVQAPGPRATHHPQKYQTPEHIAAGSNRSDRIPKRRIPGPWIPNQTPQATHQEAWKLSFWRVHLWWWGADREAWISGLGLFNVGVGDIYNGFKLLFLVSGPRALGIKTLYISSSHLKEIWRVQILTSGTKSNKNISWKKCIFALNNLQNY